MGWAAETPPVAAAAVGWECFALRAVAAAVALA